MPNLPDHSRVWIYTSSREFTNDEVSQIENAGKEFVNSWKAHGSAIEAEFQVIYNRFIVISADEQVSGVSGCSIDSSVKFLSDTESRFKVSLMDKMNLGYHGPENKVAVLHMVDFQKEMDNGGIHSQTMVFNNLVANLGELRTSWEVPLVESWHKQLL